MLSPKTSKTEVDDLGISYAPRRILPPKFAKVGAELRPQSTKKRVGLIQTANSNREFHLRSVYPDANCISNLILKTHFFRERATGGRLPQIKFTRTDKSPTRALTFHN